MSKVIQRLETSYDQNSRKEQRAFNGKVLWIDLSDYRMWVESPEEDIYRKYIGGRGFVLYYLLREVPAGTDALGPDNLLVFAPGILTGTILPGTGKHGVGAKSPLTGALASSETGGFWGSELKKAGFDALIVRGKSERPVYIWIKDGAVEIRDASHLWGKTTGETEDQIRYELNDERVRVSMIGPGGEHLVKYSALINDSNRAAGRSGLGAVMGSKNLKAVAVRGSVGLGLADQNLMQQVMKWILGTYKSSMKWAIDKGTSGDVKYLHDIGSTPVHNYQDGVFGNIDNLDASNFHPIMLVGRDTCNHCPVKCKIVVERISDQGINISRKYGGPEYESIGTLGPLCMVDDPVIVAKANELCAAYALDTISTGATIAFTMECVERGLLKTSEMYPFLPTFGDGNSLLKSIELIAYRKGIGDLMAEGSDRMAEILGGDSVNYTVTAKRQEFPAHDPRFRNATGLGYALSPTGADHMHNINDWQASNPNSDTCQRLRELNLNTPLPLYELSEDKVIAFGYELEFKHFCDSAVICQFYPYLYQHMVDAVSAATGWDFSKEEILEVGRRIATMGRLFLLREGFSAQDDKLPLRMTEPHSDGPIAGKTLTAEALRKAIQRHYEFMGWDECGVPSPEELKELSLNWVKERKIDNTRN